MPQKRKQRLTPMPDPPTASSSSESEEDGRRLPSSQPHATAAAAAQVSSSGEEDDSSQDEDQEQLSIVPASANPPSSESEFDTDSEPTQAKPKPTDQAQRSPAPAKLGSKRPAHSTDPKRAKKKATGAPSSSVANGEEEEDGKKFGSQSKMFQRIWSEEDELGILKGMTEFISKTGQEPYRYADAFHSFVKKSLHVEVSSNQLKEKIRRLKKKFETHVEKEKKGMKPRLLKPHDKTVFELSKKIWDEGPNGLVEKPKPKEKAAAKTPKKESATMNMTKPKPKAPSQPSAPPRASPEPGKHDSGDVSLLYRKISCFKELDEDEMKRGLSLIGESKRKELEKKWKMLRHSEMELIANRSLLIGEQIKLVSEALHSSNR